MYAIISEGGRQLKVEEGQELQVDYRNQSAGAEVRFDRVLAVSDTTGLKVGKPTLAGAAVMAEVVATELGPKLTVQKFRRRKNARRRTGHRQIFTRVKIKKIEA